MTETSDEQWIFGLSIDEECSWLAVTFDQSGKLGQKTLSGSFAELTEDPSQPTDLEEYLIANLQLVKIENPQIFRGCLAFGISSIGVSDDDAKTLKNIDRKRWKRNRDGVLVNFQIISNQLFEPKPKNISVSNDTAAKAVAEYVFRNDESIELMFFAIFSEGVNGAFLRMGRPISWPLHQELGHIYPLRYPEDIDLDPHFSGCEKHASCFEGLASMPRIRKQIKDIPESSAFICEAICWYVAQFCYNAIVTMQPTRIVLRGDVIDFLVAQMGTSESVIKEIEEMIDDFNCGSILESKKRKRKDPYMTYDAMRTKGFLSLARFPNLEGSALRGAVELARRAFGKPYVLRSK